MKDIEGIADIKILVDRFYEKVRRDELLAPVFASRINDWQPHLQTMYRFWNAALLGVRGYVGNPFSKHATLAIDGRHFDQWIRLFYETIDEHFVGPVADDAKTRSMIMAHTFYQRMHEHNVGESSV